MVINVKKQNRLFISCIKDKSQGGMFLFITCFSDSWAIYITGSRRKHEHSNLAMNFFPENKQVSVIHDMLLLYNVICFAAKYL